MPSAVDAASALYGLGLWLLEQRRVDDAIHVFRTLTMTAPRDERGFLGLGTCHELAGHDHAACDLYALGRASVTTSFRCALAEARVLRRADESDRADDAFELAIERARFMNEDEIADAIAHERRTA